MYGQLLLVIEELRRREGSTNLQFLLETLVLSLQKKYPLSEARVGLLEIRILSHQGILPLQRQGLQRRGRREEEGGKEGR